MKREVIIHIKNEVNVIVKGLTPLEYKECSDNFSYFTKNYLFNPAFKMKQWDGRISFFTVTGKTYISMLREVIRFIKKKFNISTVDIIDDRVYIPCIVETQHSINEDIFKDHGIVLGQHQVDACNAVLNNKGRGIIRAGTGAGKSFICAALSRFYEETCGFKSVIIVPSSDLVEQTYNSYKKVGLNCGRLNSKHKELTATHLITTWQSLSRQKDIINWFNVVIVDEVHLASGTTIKNMLLENAINVPVRIGLTGTIPLHIVDSTTIKCALGEVIYEIPASTLIERGWLSKILINVITLEEDFTERYNAYLKVVKKDALTYKEFKNNYFLDYSAEKAFLNTKAKRLDFISQLIIEMTEKGVSKNTLILVPSIAMGDLLSKYIENSVFVNGQDSVKVRQKIYSLFQDRDDMMVIATSHIASTGLDIPRVFMVVTIDAGKSFTKIIQTVGRGLRKAADKDSVIMLDVSSDLKYASKHRRERLKYYEEEKYPVKKSKFEYEKYFKNDDVQLKDGFTY